jgi:hypothetical protein
MSGAAVLRYSLAVVIFTVGYVVCTAAILYGILSPRSSPRRALTTLGQFNREAMSLIMDLR